MRRRKAERVRSSLGQVGSHGVRKSRLASRSAAHSGKSVICGVRRVTPSPAIEGSGSLKLMVRKNAMVAFGKIGGFKQNGGLKRDIVRRPGASDSRRLRQRFQVRSLS